MTFTDLEKKNYKYACLDPFHISQAILRNVSDKKGQKELLNFFRDEKVDEGLEAITNLLILNNGNEKAFNKLVTLYDYLVSNRYGLIPYKLRDNLETPLPLEGVEYKLLRTMKHNICDVLSQRMKGREIIKIICKIIDTKK